MLKVALLKVPVTDLSRSVAFYEAALGLQAGFVAEAHGWAQLDGAGVPMALYVPGRGGGNRTPGGSVDFHLSHPALDQLSERAATVAPDAAVFVNDDGSASLEFRDPDGNLLKIIQSR